MASEWRHSTWGDEISLEYGKRLSGYEDGPGPVPVFGANGPVGWTTSALAEGPGVILGRKGVHRGVEYSKIPFFVIDTAYFVRPKRELSMRWLYYAMQHHRLGEIDDGSPIPSTTRSAVYVRPLEVPPLGDQSRMAGVLGAFDDKIELNRRMNRTLEKMAAAIFKSWFIDFDPVHAKAEGRDPNLPSEIADLFPDTFEDSALGPIPKGWASGKLSDVADNPRRTVKPSDVPPATPYIGLQHMPRCCIALDAWGRADEVGSGKSQFKEGEILFGKLRPYFHKVGIAPVDGVCSTDIVVVTPKAAHWHGYVIALVSSKAFVDYTDSHSAGTKMPRTNWKDMGRYPLALPPKPLAKAFQVHVAAFHQRIGLAVRQNRRIAGLRDTLLPKLLGGEIELPDDKNISNETTLKGVLNG